MPLKQDKSPVNMQIEVKMVRRKADIKEYYADVFEGVGRFPGPPYHIQLDPKIPPKTNTSKTGFLYILKKPSSKS